MEHQFWGESSARVTYVRKMQRKFVPFYYAPFVPAWHGQLTVPTRVVSNDTGEVFNLFDIPASIADQSDARFDNIPDGDFDYDTIEFAFNKRFGSRFFTQSSFDYQWRDELRSPDIDNWGSTSPLVADPIGVNYFLNPNPAVSNRQETTVYHLAMMGRYVFPREIRICRQLPLPERLPVRPHHFRRNHDADTQRHAVAVLRRRPGEQSIGQRASAQFPRRQGVQRWER